MRRREDDHRGSDGEHQEGDQHHGRRQGLRGHGATLDRAGPVGCRCGAPDLDAESSAQGVPDFRVAPAMVLGGEPDDPLADVVGLAQTTCRASELSYFLAAGWRNQAEIVAASRGRGTSDVHPERATCRPWLAADAGRRCTTTSGSEERDPDLFRHLGVPRSTAASWLRRVRRPVVSADDLARDGAQLHAQVLALRHRIGFFLAAKSVRSSH
jgi:hypothetical protein